MILISETRESLLSPTESSSTLGELIASPVAALRKISGRMYTLLLCHGKGGQPTEAPEREAAMLELSITFYDAGSRAKRLAKNVPEMFTVVEAV